MSYLFLKKCRFLTAIPLGLAISCQAMERIEITAKSHPYEITHKPDETKPIPSVPWQSLLDYTIVQPPPPSVNVFKPQENKELIFIAVEHSSNLQHQVIRAIKSVIASKKPQFAILEGFNPEDGISPQWVIDRAKKDLSTGKCPENAYTAYHCKKNNIPFMGGDIHNEKYLEPLAKRGYLEKDVVFWMLAQNFPFWNREGIVNDENFKELAADMIQNKITFWLNKPKLEYTVDEFLEWHEKHMGKPLDVVKDFPWGYDRKEFMPSLAEDATIYQKIQAHIMPLRDTHLINLMKESLEKYDTVLVVFGASHYEWQKSALELLFGKPKHSYSINLADADIDKGELRISS